MGGFTAGLGFPAVAVGDSTCSGLPCYLVRDIAGESELTLRTAQILCVLLGTEWMNIIATGASAKALVSIKEKSSAE